MVKFSLKKDSKTPLYNQIMNFFKKEIQNKKLLPGDKLPTVVELSKSLNVTQATVIRAYEELTKESLIVSFVGRGTYVNDTGNINNFKDHKTKIKYTQSPLEPSDPEFALAARRLRMGTSRNLEALKILLQRPGLINFTSGIPDPKIADPGILKKCADIAFEKGQSLYQDYTDPAGMIELRKAIADKFRKNGTNITADHVMITSGSQQAVSVLSQVALENRYRIICESPCYMGIPNAFGAIGHWVESLPRDDNGPVMEKFARYHDNRQSLLYLCPLLHNPMGTDLMPDKIKIIKTWAQEQNSLIISDEIYSDLHFSENKRGSLFDEFGRENTVVIGSLSKSFMCGLRIGWLVATPDRIHSYIGLKRAMDIGLPGLMQGIALALLESGEYEKHIQKAREHYRIRRDALLKALEKYMPEGVTWTIPQGGIHIWIRLPKYYSSIVLFLLAIEAGVGIFPGPLLDIDHRFINEFKLSYGSLSPEQIQEGIPLLSGAVIELLKNPATDPGMSGLGDF
jgi:2-aminoadipate transaminase